jgi:hypothetical protein
VLVHVRLGSFFILEELGDQFVMFLREQVGDDAGFLLDEGDGLLKDHRFQVSNDCPARLLDSLDLLVEQGLEFHRLHNFISSVTVRKASSRVLSAVLNYIVVFLHIAVCRALAELGISG